MLISDWQPNYQWKWWRNTSRLTMTRLQHRVCLKAFHKGTVVEFVVADVIWFCFRKRTKDRTLHHPLQRGWWQSIKPTWESFCSHMLIQNWRLFLLFLFSLIFDSYLATAIFCLASGCFSETCCFLTSLCVCSVSFLFICLNLLTENKAIIVLDQWSICSKKAVSTCS